MLFNSLTFLLFLPIVFAAYWSLKGSLRWQNILVVVASYVFYGWWDWRFLLLIAFTTACSYASGLLIAGSDSRRQKKFWMWLNIAINLGILAIFKYFDFFAANFAALLNSVGITVDGITLGLVLPVGISFYTFQALSYSIDVYREKIKPTHDPVSFFAFISFFPQLVAGPIERAVNILPQFEHERTFDYAMAVSGLRLMLWGFFKKTVVADNLGPYVDSVFANYETAGSLTLIGAALMFTIQIYCDFSGYSDIGIGTGRLFGIQLMRNFNLPYFSRSIGEFWRRWHISLTSWFRDYVYIPLGGSRVRSQKIARNTLVVFLVSGLWHGAAWTFVAWGAYHAVMFIPGIIRGKKDMFKNSTVAENRRWPSFYESLLMGRTFLLVAIGWILFRSDSLSDAWTYICHMFTRWNVHTPVEGKASFIWIAVLLVAEWFSRHKESPLSFEGHGLMRYRIARWTVYWLIVVCIILFYRLQSFIYFQF